MPSKLRKAIGAVKDQTSIGIAKVSTTSSLDVAILKATTHEEFPVEERFINEILLITSSNKMYAAACAQALAKRIGRTRNWIVALKSLMLVLRLFQDGDPYFPREVLVTMKRGGKILNLANFRDDSNSSPWDYTAFIRTVALYLSSRLECFLTGRLQRRVVSKGRDHYLRSKSRTERYNERVRDMKPAVLLDRISHWQNLLDRAIGTRPTGAARTNRLIKTSLYSIVRETFDIYLDISDGLGILLDGFFEMDYHSCVKAFDACTRSSQQYRELSNFYAVCKDIGVGRSSEYPVVQKISEELMDTLKEFIKDQTPFPGKLLTNGNERSGSSPRSHIPEQNERTSTEGLGSVVGIHPHDRRRGMSLEDLISVTDAGTCYSPSFSVDQRSTRLQSSSSIEDFQSMETPGTSPPLSTAAPQERCQEGSGMQSPIDDLLSLHTAGTSPAMSVEQRNSSATDPGIFSLDDLLSLHTARTSPARSIDQSYSSVTDLAVFDDGVQTQPQEEANKPIATGHDSGSRNEWELVLAEANKPSVPGQDSGSKNGWELVLAEANKPSLSGHDSGSGNEWELVLAETNKPSVSAHDSGSRNEWELVLAETATSTISATQNSTPTELTFPNNFYSEVSASYQYSNCSNPFLNFGNELPVIPFPAADSFSALPTFQATPTFCAKNPNEIREDDPFGSPRTTVQMSSQGTFGQPHLMLEQQLWLQNQNQIISRHIS